MKKAKILSIFLTFIFLFKVLPHYSTYALTSPDTSAASVYIVEASSGEALLKKNENKRVEPSCISKVMTVLLALEACDRGEIALSDIVTASYTSHNDLTPDCRTQNIVPSESMPLEDLLYCAIVASANEACNIIGEHVSDGDIFAFVDLMNQRASDLGCTDTHFENAHGLPVDGQYTTAKDIYIIAREAMKHPIFAEICSTTSKELAATNLSDTRYITTTNYLISLNHSSYYYAYAYGIKSGGTDSDGYSIVSTASKNGLELYSVVAGVPNTVQEDGSEIINVYGETKALYEWIFSNYSYRDIISTDDLICEVEVRFSSGKDSVVLCPGESLTMLLPSDISLDDFETEVTVYDAAEDGSIKAPIEKGEVLGEISLSFNGENYGTVPLVALTAVNVSAIDNFMGYISSILSSKYFKLILAAIAILVVTYIVLAINYNIKRRKKRVTPGYKGNRRR